METINLYVVLAAPSRGNLAIVHNEEVGLDAYERLRAAYDPSALDGAVMAASDWLERGLEARKGGQPLLDGEEAGVLSREETGALQVLLKCLAAQVHDAIQAGNRWAVIEVRYHDEEAHITVGASSTAPDFAAPAPAGHG